jgi:hypothetical protein
MVQNRTISESSLASASTDHHTAFSENSNTLITRCDRDIAFKGSAAVLGLCIVYSGLSAVFGVYNDFPREPVSNSLSVLTLVGDIVFAPVTYLLWRRCRAEIVQSPVKEKAPIIEMNTNPLPGNDTALIPA